MCQIMKELNPLAQEELGEQLKMVHEVTRNNRSVILKELSRMEPIDIEDAP